jgi:hypothetical protein
MILSLIEIVVSWTMKMWMNSEEKKQWVVEAMPSLPQQWTMQQHGPNVDFFRISFWVVAM